MTTNYLKKKITPKNQHVFILFVLFATSLFGQDFEELKEWFTLYPNKKAYKKDTSLYKSKLILAPVITYAPETNFGFGVGSKYLFKFKGSGKETRTSNIPISLRYTLNNQFIFYSGFEVFTNQEKYVILGNVLFQNYPRLYYGLGRNSMIANEEEYNYYQFLIEPLILKRLFFKYLFIGGGLRYNKIYDVNIQADIVDNSNRPLGFFGNTSVGAEFALLYDSRNNILNANKGWFLNFTHGIYDQSLGSTHKFQLTRFDLRHYIKLFQEKNDVLAFQFRGHYSHGDTPFAELALLGSDSMMRGYREGRYIDRHMLAGQVEYRKTFRNSRWGFVIFAGAGDVFSSFNNFTFSNLFPNAGAGLRYTIDHEENLNLRFDFGMGENTNNIYFNIAESF